MRLASIIALAAGATMLAAPAHADWRMTRWGMGSARAVQAAARTGLALSRMPDPFGLPGGVAFGGDDVVAHIAVREVLLFGANDALSEVDVSPARIADCDDFRVLAVTRFGASDELSVSDAQKVWRWRDKKSDVDVAFTIRYAPSLDRSETACFIAYTKLTRPGRIGL